MTIQYVTRGGGPGNGFLDTRLAIPNGKAILALFGRMRETVPHGRLKQASAGLIAIGEGMAQRYLLITPCRDEADVIQNTIDTVAEQTVRPAKWVIVDDGSTDETPAILAAASKKYPFIEIVIREDRGERSVGPGVVDAFYAGLETVEMSDFDFLCKLDGDLRLPQRYFEIVMSKFEHDPYLGSFSGKLYFLHNGELTNERVGDENAIGPAKFFRVACFRDIGGFVRQVGWDGIDGHMCRMKGWITCSEDDPDIRLIHLHMMGSTQKSLWAGRLRWGKGKYFMGSAPYYVLAVALYRMFTRPYIVGGVGIFVGYMGAKLAGEPRMQNTDYLRHFRRYELSSLFLGKRRTMRRYHDMIRKNFRPPALRNVP